ncbi:MAG: helix-turn-helix domain-containing protein [Candidatus Gastranaerophilaceae bacterium]
MDEENIKNLLGLRIKQLRKQFRFTQAYLGELTDIDQRQIAYIEGGNCFPSLKTLNKLSKAFNCSIKDLFDYEHLKEEDDIKDKLCSYIQTLDNKKLKLIYEIIKTINNNLDD